MNHLFPGAEQLQDRCVAQIEADTSLRTAFHATGDLEGAQAVQQAKRNAQDFEGQVPEACSAASRAQSLALLLAMSPMVSHCVATPVIVLHSLLGLQGFTSQGSNVACMRSASNGSYYCPTYSTLNIFNLFSTYYVYAAQTKETTTFFFQSGSLQTVLMAMTL